MIILYDTECKKCGNIEEQYIENGSFLPCSKCGGEIRRIFSKFNFKLIYNNKTDVCAWGDNNYETSQYWSKVKEARERGEKVKGVGEE